MKKNANQQKYFKVFTNPKTGIFYDFNAGLFRLETDFSNYDYPIILAKEYCEGKESFLQSIRWVEVPIDSYWRTVLKKKSICLMSADSAVVPAYIGDDQNNIRIVSKEDYMAYGLNDIDVIEAATSKAKESLMISIKDASDVNQSLIAGPVQYKNKQNILPERNSNIENKIFYLFQTDPESDRGMPMISQEIVETLARRYHTNFIFGLSSCTMWAISCPYDINDSRINSYIDKILEINVLFTIRFPTRMLTEDIVLYYDYMSNRLMSRKII